MKAEQLVAQLVQEDWYELEQNLNDSFFIEDDAEVDEDTVLAYLDHIVKVLQEDE